MKPQEMWDKILQRDNSVVLDHTYGQHKSTVECPKCKRVSITYNKFNQLTLPVNKKIMAEFYSSDYLKIAKT